MKLDINYTLTAGRNAEEKYLERNKYKSKLSGAIKAIEITNKKIALQDKNISEKIKEKVSLKKKIEIKKEWFHKFRFFFTTNNFLVLGGKDTKNNDFLIKKYLKENDLYFHAEIHGAPHVILKNDLKKEVPDIDKEEAACFALIFSSAWKNKAFSTEVYSVLPDQVSKTANTGESVGAGAFVIRGKRDYYKKLNLKLKLIYDDKKGLYPFPVLFTSENNKSKDDIFLVPGDLKKSDASKEIKNIFIKRKISLSQEEIDASLPPGSFEILK
jgi:predicted ribosome quality control (RQC) complex YloA/Tae2 family protein